MKLAEGYGRGLGVRVWPEGKLPLAMMSIMRAVWSRWRAIAAAAASVYAVNNDLDNGRSPQRPDPRPDWPARVGPNCQR